MKRTNRNIVYLIIAILAVLILTTVVVAVDSDLSKLIGTRNKHIGDTFILSYSGTLANNTSAYCIQKGKNLGEDRQFILDKYVELDGKQALVYRDYLSTEKPEVVIDDLNAQISYILGKEQGYGTKENKTDAQNALWHITNAWTTKIFGNNEYSWDANSEVDSNFINKEAEDYAEAIGNQKAATIKEDTPVVKVQDKTNAKNISVMNVDGYFRVGPFRWEFDGALQEIIVTSNIGVVSNSDLRFVKYSGTHANIVNASDIETGEAFYIDINRSTGISQLTGIKLKTTSVYSDLSKIYTAKIWFFHTSSYQNLIYVDVESFDIKPAKGEGESSYNINFSTSIGLTKVDDRNTSIPLVGVGFTFKATIQTYDVVGHTDHYKKVSCSHVVRSGYTDNEGTYHAPIYRHSYDEVFDWTQYHYEWTDHTMYLDSSVTWNPSYVHTHYTNNSGRILLESIKYPTKIIVNETSKGSSYISTARLKPGTKVIAEEVSNPYYGYSIGSTYPISINFNTKLENKIITNHQRLVKLSGFVWLDENSEKTTIRNDKHDVWEDGLNGITVYLKDISGNIIKTTRTSELGIYSEILGGEYRFVDVNLDDLQAGRYYIEFEYCGITYQSVNALINQNKGSKAIDRVTRNVLDRKFASVNSSGTQSLDISNVKVNYNGINNYVSTIRNHTGCNVYARTNEAGYNLYNSFTPTYEEIRYINLGLFEKAQTDYALSQDLYDVKINVNGFAHIYRYAATRYNEDGSINEKSAWDIGVKFQKNSGTYNRAIYTSDTEYEASKHADNEIKVYITYKVALKNESSYLGRVNNIVDYCDNRYNLIAAGTSIDDNDKITNNISYSSKITYNSEYSKYVIYTNTTLDAGETKYIYLQFELNRAAVLTILNNGELLNNVAEINSYTTFKERDISKPVSVIDKDSVPGNAIPGQINTYEDDTDAARSLKLELKYTRTLSGTVFIDSTRKDSDKVYTGQERLGNGIFDAGEKTLSGVTVTLREAGKDDSSYDGERIEMQTVTDINGNFEFVNYIPGDYTLTYTWGDKDYKVQYYKGTIYDESRNQNNRYWYKVNEGIRKTDALDNYDIRNRIDNEMEALKYNTLENEINKAYESTSEHIKQTRMNSTTPIMSLNVEYKTVITSGMIDEVQFSVKNVDFGIVERPKQQLELTKRVSAFKVTLANGQIVIDAKVTEEGRLEGIRNYATYMGPSRIGSIDINGIVKGELDEDLIQGATLETEYTMKVTNIGEVDYSSSKYYYYGNKTGADFVKVSVTELLDYVDGRLSMLDNKWSEQHREYINKVNASEKDNEVYLNTTRSYLTRDLSKALAPNQAHSVNIHTSKLLTTTDDNTFENKAEITQVTKTDAFNTGTPVKVNWDEDKFNFDTDNAETVIIIPSTGDNKAYAIPAIVGITMLSILAIGIVFIRKFVKNNK